MKKFLFLVLILAIGAAAYFAKPQDPKVSFANYLVDRSAKGDTILPAAWNEVAALRFADRCDYRDRLLWVDVKFHDKTVYTNVFSHWINRAELKNTLQDDVEKAKDKLDHAADKLAGKQP